MPHSTSKNAGKVRTKKPAPARKKTTASKAQLAARKEIQAAPVVSDYAIGDDVIHPQFGDGAVTAIEGEKLTIKFADGRVKQILDYYVKRR
jgi:DNA helicase-2/ATP-dependent DNA helicase PcrA